MDIRQALVTALYKQLTTDTDLLATCGGTVRLVNGMPPPDTEFPYLTHRLVLETGASWAFAEGDWYLDLWDHSPNQDRLLAMRQDVIVAVDQLLLPLPSDGVVLLQIQLVRDEDGVTDAPDIFRLMTQWKLYLDRQAEVEAILSR